MQKKDLVISLINFNTLGVPVLSKHLTERYVTLATTIEQHTDADILTFQEVHTYVHLQLLRKLLPHFPYVIYKKFIYGPKGGLVIFSKIPIETKQFNQFSKRGNIRNRTFYASLVRTGTLACKLKDYPVYILNSYFTTNPNNTWIITNPFSKIQETQIRDLANLIKKLKQNNDVIIVTGDFNFTKTSSSYELFTSLTQTEDVFKTFSLPTYLFERKMLKFAWHVKLLDRLFVINAKESGQVDFVFLSADKQKVNVKEKNYIFAEKMKLFNGKESYLSDHLGLYAKLEIHV
ncbi:MAG TPA: endonuclease/exonuclease/phosphatase family protein [Patescibacteria group bacterium]|nr:endonuclease/exonuclease/phosphatase family protein [Patescibacteria group bacterium]